MEYFPLIVLATVFSMTWYKIIVQHSLVSDTYLLLTEFEVRTVSYGPSVSPLVYDPSAAMRAGHKSRKNEDT